MTYLRGFRVVKSYHDKLTYYNLNLLSITKRTQVKKKETNNTLKQKTVYEIIVLFFCNYTASIVKQISIQLNDVKLVFKTDGEQF